MNKEKSDVYTIRSHSNLGYQISKKILEREFENIAEESSAQYTQKSSIKRENSAIILRTKREGSISKEEVFKLDSDLLNLRKQYLVMVEEKLKVEKEIITCKIKLKSLEEKSVKDEEKLGKLQQKVKNNKGLKKKYLEISDRFKEVNEKLKEVVGKVEKDRNYWVKEFEVYEDRVNKLMKENVSLKQEVFYKEEYCEKLKKDLEDFREGGKEKCVNRAVKTLSELILSKDQKSTTQKIFPSLLYEKTIESLNQKIESLEAKLDFFSHNQDFLSIIQFQASVIEDYLNEALDLSNINSPLLSL